MPGRRQFLLQASAAGMLAAFGGGIGLAQNAAGKTARKGVVQTVLGPIDASRLGFTLTHEHVGSGSSQGFGSRADALASAVVRLKQAKAAGVDTIIDVTPFDTGRDVRFCEEVSRKSGVHIVVCTGQHLFAPQSLEQRSVEEITELFIREIEQGIDDTGIKPGVIKVASRGQAMTPAETNVFKAAARASKATGVPIETHTNARRRGGEAQVAVFEAEGLSPSAVALGHSDDAEDMDYLTGLIGRGYTLGMDHLFRGNTPEARVPWQQRAARIKQLIDAGCVDRIFLSNDWVHGDAERTLANPDGLLFNTRKTIPYLRRLGVARRDIRIITIENPKRFFARS